jgi:nuclear pore complex protein Nup205
LRNLRNKEEDAPRRSQVAPPPAHFQDYLWLASAVYRSLPPDSAEELWENTAFTSAVLDTRGSWPGPAYWDLMVAISTGPICAAKCYERIKDTRLQWSGLFKFYQHYTDIMPHLFEPIKSTRAASLDPMSMDEVEICKGWTKLLATVVQWSPLARIALLQAKTHPLQQLFELVNCDVPVDLKAVILQAITAFCKRTGDTDDVPNKALDYYERISFADPTLDTRNLGSSRIPTPIGWIAKMEYAEQDLQSYPCSRAYIEFLTTLIPSTSAHSTPRLNNALRRGFYYIVDRVLCVDRRYVKENEKWETLEAIFAFIEKALLAFNMSELVSVASRSIGPIATALADEPGFLVLLRLLSELDIFESLALVIDHAAQMTPRPAHVQRVLLSVLRIYQRVLDIQLVFSDVLLLTLSDPSRGSTFRRPLGLQSLDQYLLGRLSNVNAIALLVGDDDLAAALVSVKIIAFLSSSPVFSRSDVFRGEYSTSINRLAGIIDASDDSIRIAQGFCSRLDGDGQDLTAKEVADAQALVLDGSGPADPLLVRHAILDLLLDGTTSSRPNLAHFLLGFDYRAPEFGLQDPRSPESRLSCFHVVLRQLTEEHLFVIHPTCATKNAQLVHQLFAHPVTGRATMSYASSIADFFPRQLASLPRLIPPATKDAPDLGVAVGREQVITTAEILVAFLEFQRWIVSSAALESFAFEGHGPSAERMAEILFEDEEDEEGSAVRPPLIISLVGNIDIQWQDTPNQEAARNLEFFSGFDFDQFKRPDVDWWDLEALERSMQTFRRQLERQGAVQTGTPAVAAEIEFVVRKLGAKNRETNVALAKGDLLTAWSEALKVSLTMLFRHVAEEQQEAVLFGLLDALLNRFEADLAPGVLEILCESVLVTVTTLVSVLSATDGVNLPVERLATVMRGILDAVTLPGVTETARGNLYASMSQYLQLVTQSHAVDDAAEVASLGGQFTLQAGAKGLRRATVSVLATKDRFLSTLCRDAMDDRDVWKTECFALLGGIVSICHTQRERQILSPISANGFLALFVASIKDREIALSECLGPDFGESRRAGLADDRQSPRVLGLREQDRLSHGYRVDEQGRRSSSRRGVVRNFLHVCIHDGPTVVRGVDGYVVIRLNPLTSR